MASYAGKPTCSCGAAWFPAYVARLATFGIVIRFTQLIGSYGASAGTHGAGLCFDFVVVSTGKRTLSQAYNIAIREARNMGADATWERPYNWDGRGGIRHGHGLGNACPHLRQAAKNQQTAVRAGRNGLANNRADTGPRPLSGRTWRQGITWATKQTPEKKDWFDMATEAQLRKIVREEIDAAQKSKTVTVYEPTRTAAQLKKNPKASPATMLGRVNAKVDELTALVKAMQGGGSGKA